MGNFLDYFARTAQAHAKNGKRYAALKAIWRAFAVLPTRAVRLPFSQSPLRDALVIALKGPKADKALTRHTDD
jgi:hypothetical protein